MHRNVAIWENRRERLEAVLLRQGENFRQARRSPYWNEASEARRDAWRKRYDAVERRVWLALCVAKGWRKG